MRYALLLTGLESEGDTPSRLTEEMQGLWRAFFSNPNLQQHVVASVPLLPTDAARTVRVRDGRRLVTDGPFAETKEQLGGVILIEVEDRDTAVAIAKEVPCLGGASVEIRPLLDTGG